MTTPHDKALIAELAQMYADHLDEAHRALQFGAYVPIEDDFQIEIPLRILRIASELHIPLEAVNGGDFINQEQCAVLIDQMLMEPAFLDHPRMKLALTIAARAIRRGRHLDQYERMQNLKEFLDPSTPSHEGREKA